MPIAYRKFPRTFLIILFAMTLGAASAQLSPMTYQRLMNIDQFAFGGVGIAGTTSEGEVDFRILMREDKVQALAQLEKLYAEGNPQAKAYALAGLHGLNIQRFNELSGTLPKIKVNTMRGCIAATKPLTSVGQEIASGEYDRFVKYPAPPAIPLHPQSPHSHPPPRPPHLAT